jgi:O-acetyl-ADP-ribose deacetylase (regulator of RNase III)
VEHIDYPIDKACSIAINEIAQFLALNKELEKVYMVCFDTKVANQFEKLLKD